jgi:hypothetical protein
MRARFHDVGRGAWLLQAVLMQQQQQQQQHIWRQSRIAKLWYVLGIDSVSTVCNPQGSCKGVEEDTLCAKLMSTNLRNREQELKAQQAHQH